MTSFDDQLKKIKTADGFIAALDQSGGSTPKALRQYGIAEGAWTTEDEMFDLVHQMRTRIITSDAFDGDRILGAILFVGTMDRDIEGVPTPMYLWEQKGIVPFLKVDKGLADLEDGVQLMKPIPDLGEVLQRASSKGVFGTKMRSVVKEANPAGVDAIVRQQFKIGEQILAHGLVPILEPEVDIHCPDKEEAEELLRASLMAGLDRLSPDASIMFKLTLPEVDNYYQECVDHPGVLKVVALSGGYTREEANARLVRNRGVVASFSRALVEGLSASSPMKSSTRSSIVRSRASSRPR